ncbi:MAG: hypothetical protein WC905_02370 [Patescibacteria group bacterium]
MPNFLNWTGGKHPDDPLDISQDDFSGFAGQQRLFGESKRSVEDKPDDLSQEIPDKPILPRKGKIDLRSPNRIGAWGPISVKVR